MSTTLRLQHSQNTTEPIVAVVFGDMGWGDYGSEAWTDYTLMPKGVILTEPEAAKWLDVSFDNGFGAPGCPAVYIYTETTVSFVVQYDGSTQMSCIPRNPSTSKAEMPGG